MPDATQHVLFETVQKEEDNVIGRKGPDDQIAGLAISGGGIRSATFALGVLESLKASGLLDKFDYLSTVSGGGYIGSWLSANCRRREKWLTTADWTESINYLRRYSNYLSPQVGFFSADTWSMLTIWLRNTLLIQATTILAIACALLAPRPLLWAFHHYPDAGDWRWLAVLLFLFAIVGIAGNHWQLTTMVADDPKSVEGNANRLEQNRPPRRRPIDLLKAESWRRGLGTSLGLFAIAVVAMRVLGFDPFAIYTANDSAQTLGVGVTRTAVAFVIGALLMLSAFFLQPVAVVVASWLDKQRPEQVNYTQPYVLVCVVTPLMITALLVTSVLWAQATGRPNVTSLTGLKTYSALLTEGWKFWPFHLSIVFVSFWLLSFFAIANRREPRRLLVALLAPVVAVPVLHACFAAIVLIFQMFAAQPHGGEWMVFVWGPAMVAFAFALAIVVLIGMLGRDSTDGVREWWSRLGAWLAIASTAWMVIAVSAIYSPMWVDWVVHKVETGKTITGLAGWVATVAGGLMSAKSPSTAGAGEEKSMPAKAMNLLARVAPFVFIAGVLVAVSWVVHLMIGLNSGPIPDPNWWTADVEPLFGVPVAMLVACGLATALLAARVDINEFSLNAFYRNRLVRCYLGATRDEGKRNPQNFTNFDDKDDTPLALEATAMTRPLHIVNCALNLGGSSDLALHTRHSASFTLTPLYCGSAYPSRDLQGNVQELGFVPTKQYGKRTGGPTLGQAISVSGAAASPNMGYHTSSVTAFLMTLFNVRLGWWFPNPMMASQTLSPNFSLAYLTAELFGGANDKTPFVMVSDGGHFENLAAYELIRRRCRVIVILDGECDKKYSFEGLGTLIRMCEVDFGCRIDINVEAIRPKGTPATWSDRRYATGTITYQDGTKGTLVYLKASMTGSEDTSVRQYKSSHPEFPHESTGDQFYGEDQFESYRHLGRDIGREVFASLAGQPTLATAIASLASTKTTTSVATV